MAKNNFEKSLELVLQAEGGFINHPKDPGGMTNLGVTKAVYDKWIGRASTEEEMRALKPEDVAPIYKKNYWDKIYGDQLESGLDFALFDWAVNSGPGRAAKAIQRIVGATQDGAIGPKTMQKIANNETKFMIEKLHDQRQAFYEGLSTFKHFGRGWTRRNKHTKEEALNMVG